jgi:MFS family permease
MTSASISTANAYIADVTPAEKRAAAFGMLGAAFGLGFVIDRRWVVCWAASISGFRSGWRRV